MPLFCSTIVIDDIAILFERSRRAKRLNISLKPFRGVRVAVPLNISFDQAEQAVSAKISWIRHHYARVKELEGYLAENSLRDTPIDRDAAEKKLTERLKELADRHCFRYNQVCIRNQKTRWGSCSARNNISLNLKLMLLPDNLIDFVLLHELVHTRIKNHGKEFWSELAGLLGGADVKNLRLQMKKYGLRIL
jgi:hypothetical protein